MMPRWTLGIVAATTIFLAGCASPERASRGVVRFADGDPVRSGTIELRSTDDGDRYTGPIDRDGRFELTDASGGRGCPPGRYEVVVVQVVLADKLALKDHTHGSTVPRRYADYYTSGLRVDVADSVDDEIKVVLEKG